MSCSRGCCETQAEHFKSLTFNGWGSYNTQRRETIMSKDMAAFKRLRDEGLRPGRLTGARLLERDAEIPQEVQLGHGLDKATKQALKQGDGEIVGL